MNSKALAILLVVVAATCTTAFIGSPRPLASRVCKSRSCAMVFSAGKIPSLKNKLTKLFAAAAADGSPTHDEGKEEVFIPDPSNASGIENYTPPDEKPVAKPAGFGALFRPENKKVFKKIFPQTLMMFFILFNYTILRDTKDVLVVTAPKSGAEIIPFLKTYVQLPGAIAFTVLYGFLSNRMTEKRLFYTVISAFLAFFAAFPTLIYPNISFLHPNAAADVLATIAPAFFLPIIAIFRNWTFALFYMMAELWGSVVLSLLFWGFANEINTVDEAKAYYPLFGLVANVALIFSGQYVKLVSVIRAALPAGVDKWGHSLKLLMAAVVASGASLLGTFEFIEQKVLTDPECHATGNVARKKKAKTKMSFGESTKFLANSPYIRDLATLVVSYGMAINIVEVTWKSKLKAAFPDPNAYSAFMGNFSTATGIVTLLLMLLGRVIFQKFGWGVAAMITPLTTLITGAAFFSLTLFPAAFVPVTAALGTTPLLLAVFVGAAQNIFSKGSKYSLFDPCKEMAFIPLDSESKTKGKAAIDVVCNPLGKPGGSFIQQFLIGTTGSLAASTPYLGGILGGIIIMWLNAAKSLAKRFHEKSEEHEQQMKLERGNQGGAKISLSDG